MKPFRLSNKIESKWSSLDEIRFKLNTIPYNYSKSNLENIHIVVTELLENAIKYSQIHESTDSIEYKFEFNEKMIELSVSNEVANEEDLNFLRNFFKSIDSEVKVQSLYQARIDEIFENKNLNHNRLGLLRVVAECKYDLKLTQNKNNVTITARKEI